MSCEVKGALASVHRPTGNALRKLCKALCLVVVLLAGALLLGACGRAEQNASQTKDAFDVTFATEPAAPLIGEGTVIVTIKDQAGQPVEDARVSLEANMNHAGMVPVYADITAGPGGVYRSPLKWTMGGAWYVDVKATLKDGQVIRRRFPVDVK